MTLGSNEVQRQQVSWKTGPLPIPNIHSNTNERQQSKKAPRWQRKPNNMLRQQKRRNNRRKQNQFQRKQARMDMKGRGKNTQGKNVGRLSTADMLSKFKPTQQTWQVTSGQPKPRGNNNNRGISVGFPPTIKNLNQPGRPNKEGRGKMPQVPKRGDMTQNTFKGGPPPGNVQNRFCSLMKYCNYNVAKK